MFDFDNEYPKENDLCEGDQKIILLVETPKIPLIL